LTDADFRKTKPSLFVSLPQLNSTEEKLLEPNALLIEFFEDFKNKIKNWFI
jgi:hypothetical protein